jgi:hypothetical protein
MVSLAVLLVPLEYPWRVVVHQGVLIWYKSFWLLNNFVIENSIKWKLSSTLGKQDLGKPLMSGIFLKVIL